MDMPAQTCTCSGLHRVMDHQLSCPLSMFQLGCAEERRSERGGSRPRQVVQEAWESANSALGLREEEDDMSQWSEIKPPEPPLCDLCGRLALWSHPAGGLRCGTCPRPECKHLRCEAGTRRCFDCGYVVGNRE